MFLPIPWGYWGTGLNAVAETKSNNRPVPTDHLLMLTILVNQKRYANSVDPDQMPQNEASEQGLHFFF